MNKLSPTISRFAGTLRNSPYFDYLQGNESDQGSTFENLLESLSAISTPEDVPELPESTRLEIERAMLSADIARESGEEDLAIIYGKTVEMATLA